MNIAEKSIFIAYRPTTNAIMGLTFAQYVVQPFFPNCTTPDDGVRLIAALSICEIFVKSFVKITIYPVI